MDNNTLLRKIATILAPKSGIDKNNPSTWPEDLHKIFDAYVESKSNLDQRTKTLPLIDYGSGEEE